MRTIIGVMGGGKNSEDVTKLAYELGYAIAKHGWVVLSGGRNAGVMAAVTKGAHNAGGLSIGILPDSHTERVAPYIDIPILTGMGDGRNIINVLSSRVVVALSGGAGTLSEIALALKAGRPVILLGWTEIGAIFESAAQPKQLHHAQTVTEAIALVSELIDYCVQFNKGL